MGAPGLFAFCGLVTLALGGFIVVRIRQRAAPAPADQDDFQIVPRTSPVANEMDPRDESEAD